MLMPPVMSNQCAANAGPAQSYRCAINYVLPMYYQYVIPICYDPPPHAIIKQCPPPNAINLLPLRYQYALNQ